MRDLLIDQVWLLGWQEPLNFTRDADGLHIQLPLDTAVENPICFKIRLA